MSFFSRNKKKIFVIVLVLVLLILILYTKKDRDGISLLERWVGNVISPISSFFSGIGKSMSEKISDVQSAASVKEENELLKKQLEILKEDNRICKDIIGQSEYLKREYLLRKQAAYTLVEAKIIGKDQGNRFDRFTVNRGAKDGLKKDDIVVQAVETDQGTVISGLVGKVSDVGDNWSKIITIVDEWSSVSFKTVRNGEMGMVSGNVDGGVDGYLFDKDADIVMDDELFTSGIGSVFRENIFIGTIMDINTEDELVTRISVKPAVNFKKLYKVYIIVK